MLRPKLTLNLDGNQNSYSLGTTKNMFINKHSQLEKNIESLHLPLHSRIMQLSNLVDIDLPLERQRYGYVFNFIR